MALGELDDRASVDSGDGGSNADDGIWPDDSASTCGLSRAAKGRLRERELTQLRQLVEKDDRFGRTLEKTTLAVHQLVADGNPSPALVLLASLVWQSLCLAWEVDAGHGTGKGLPKAQLRAQTTQLEDEVRQLKDDFARARSQYLKESVALRDQIRRLDPRREAEISRAVYEEEPVMFYEPLQYMDEDSRGHVAEIVEEKLKHILIRLNDPDAQLPVRPKKVVPPTSPKEPTSPKPKESEASTEKARAMAESLAAQRETSKKLTGICNATDSELEALNREVTQEWSQLQDVAQQNEFLVEEMPLDLSGPLDAAGNTVDSKANLARRRLRHVLKASSALRQTLHTSLAETQSQLHQQSQQLSGELLGATQTSLAWAPPGAPQTPGSASHPATPSGLGSTLKLNATGSLEQERALVAAQAAVTVAEEGRVAAERRAQGLESELQRLRRQAEEAGRARSKTDAGAAGEHEEELAKSQGECERLRQEVKRLQALIEELKARKGPKKLKAPEWELKWKLPTKKVFDRLYEDSIDRIKRHSVLQECMQQARSEKALEVLQSAIERAELNGIDLEDPEALVKLLAAQAMAVPGGRSRSQSPERTQTVSSVAGKSELLSALRRISEGGEAQSARMERRSQSSKRPGLPATPSGALESPFSREATPNLEMMTTSMLSREGSPEPERTRISNGVSTLREALAGQFPGRNPGFAARVAEELMSAGDSLPFRPQMPSAINGRGLAAGAEASRPRSAGLPALGSSGPRARPRSSGLRGPPSEAALAREANRLLGAPQAAQAARAPAQAAALQRSSTAPNLRAPGRRPPSAPAPSRRQWTGQGPR